MRYQAMVDRIEVAVVNVTIEVIFIADEMFPIAPLPNPAFSARSPYVAPRFRRREGFREMAFDQTPAGWKIAIPRRQCPNGVEVLRQHDPSIDVEGEPPLDLGGCFSKRVDMIDQQAAIAILKIDREEPATTGNEQAAIIRHGFEPWKFEHGPIWAWRVTLR